MKMFKCATGFKCSCTTRKRLLEPTPGTAILDLSSSARDVAKMHEQHLQTAIIDHTWPAMQGRSISFLCDIWHPWVKCLACLHRMAYQFSC